jgi:light-regulated signal transduction histidine kinase (bacteriophytochrome)
MNWERAIHPQERELCVRAFNQAVHAREKVSLDYRLQCDDGCYRWVIDQGAPFFDSHGDFQGYAGACLDLGAHRKMEYQRSLLLEELDHANTRLRRANADLEQFAYSASHDLREPVRTVSIFGDLLAERYGPDLDDQGREFLQFITSAAVRMERLLSDLLIYARAGNHAEDSDPDPTEQADAHEALEKALASLGPLRAGTDAQITADVLPCILMRPIHLQQIFRNLVGNAIKYRSERQPEVHISAKEENGEWVFSVTDNGIGIQPQYKELIFGIFKRLHSIDRYPGTGIGLALCRRIVEGYRGRIWVESEPGKGSTFSFAIPAG